MNAPVILCLVTLTFIGCGESTQKVDKQVVEVHEVLRLDNPSLFMGSTFGEFLQMNHKLGNHQQMLQYTSSETRGRHIDPVLIDFFKHMQFSYPLHLRSKKDDNGLITLYYGTTIDATEKTIQMNVIVEDDTVRLILDELNPEKPFVGI